MTFQAEPGPDLRLQELADLLRENGVRVSTAELLDASRALEVLGLADPRAARAALRTTLVKRAGDVEVFERLYDLYFGGLNEIVRDLAGELLAELHAEGLLEADREAVARVVQAAEARMHPMTQALLSAQRGQVARLLRLAGLEIDFSQMQGFMQQGFFTQRLLRGAGLGEVQEDLRALRGALADRELDPVVVEGVGKVLDAHLKAFQEAARRYVRSEFERRHLDPEDRSLLEERALHTLGRDEIERMEAVVDKLAERLRDRISRKRKVVRRGHFDVQRTMRRNMQYGGVPIRPVFRRRKPDRPDLVVLVDVSDSVRNVARFFLQFAYTLHDVFDRVRSFVFVSDLGEATDLFDELDVHQAVDLAFTGRVVNLHANSNYGRALLMFHRDHLAAVTHRTTVFVLGDGRTNYNPPQDWVLKEIRRKARRLVWLCPEDRRSWGYGDSEMLAYARHCDVAEPVLKLSDLKRVVEHVLL